MKRQKLFLIFPIIFIIHVKAQTADYRDVFVGLYHTAVAPCNNGNEQSPPNHYIRVDKDTQSTTGIIVIDTMFSGSTGFVHACTLNQSDSSYADGGQLGKFIPNDSLKIIVPGWICGGTGHVYYLKKITPVGLYGENGKSATWCLFPNPSGNIINIVIPGYSEKLKARIIDVNGKSILEKEFVSKTDMNLNILPRGVYFIQITGKQLMLNKRLCLQAE